MNPVKEEKAYFSSQPDEYSKDSIFIFNGRPLLSYTLF